MATRSSRSRTKTKGPARPQKNRKPSRKSKGGLWKKIILAACGLILLVLIAGAGLFTYYAATAEDLKTSKLNSTASSKFYDSDGNVFADLGSENRVKAKASDIPQELNDAIVSIEDQRFYSHRGVDPIRIVGSLVHNITDSSGGLQGGSTLTQQLIKLSFFSTDSSDQTLKRKAQEAWLAIKLERQTSKQQILTYYINKVYMGNGIYGMETAAQTYYGKSLKNLSLAQTALLAGLPQSPSTYEPYEHAKAATKRRNTVLYTMLQNDKISQSEYDAAVKEDVSDGLQALTSDSDSTLKITDNYLTEVIKQVEDKTGKDVYTDGLDVYTNLDLNQQTYLYNLVNGDDYISYPDDDFQVAATLMDTSGNVTAQIGGRKIADDVYFGTNLAVSTARDFGSTVKPITDYAPAFENLEISTGTRVDDSAYNYPGTDIAVNDYDNSYLGRITVREALTDSRNIPAVKLFDEVGSEDVATFLKGLGIQYKNIAYANAISSNTDTQEGTKYGISTEKSAAAYAALANGGTYYEPSYINKIEYSDGTEESFSSTGSKAMEDYTAYMVTDILKDVISSGTGTNARISNLIQAGKTGTSNYTDEELTEIPHSSSISPDVSFSGYTTHYSLSVWTGYNNRMTPVTSAYHDVASDVYREMMSYVSEDLSNDDWEMPSDVIKSNGELYIKGSKYQTALSSSSSRASSSYYSSSSSYYNNYSSSTSASTDSSTDSTSDSSSSTTVVEPSSSSSSSATPETTPSSSAETGGDGGNGDNGAAPVTP